MSAATGPARVFVDGRVIDHPTAGSRGVGRYVAGLIGGLVEVGAPIVVLYETDDQADLLAGLAPSAELRRLSPAAFRDARVPEDWFVATQLMLHPIPLDPVPSAVTGRGLPVAGVMFDVIPSRWPATHLTHPVSRVLLALRAPLVRTVDALLAISAFTADTSAAELGFPRERIGVIGAGVDDRFAPPGRRPLPSADRVLPDGDFVVAVTGGDAHKNTEGLLKEWALVDDGIRASHRLVVVAQVASSVLSQWQEAADEAGVTDDVTFAGWVTDDEMVAILQSARLSVMPSIDEGFGLPVLEAAACGCVAICSDVASLPEILDDPAARFDPFSPGDIAAAIERALTDESHRSALAAVGQRAVAKYTWRRTASETLAALDRLGPRWPRRPHTPESRLAVVGPRGEDEPGTGGHASAILDRLCDRDHAPAVDVFVDTSATDQPAATRGRPVRALTRYAASTDYDHIVAVLGSSPHHAATNHVAATTSCHVWIRDAELLSDLTSGTSTAGPPGELRSAIAGSRSIIVEDDEAASMVREAHPGGPPVLVVDADSDQRLLEWLDVVDTLDPRTIRRLVPSCGGD